MKKIFNLFSLAVLFVSIFIISAGTEVSAAEIPSSAVTVDYAFQKLIIHESAGSNTDRQIYFSVPTIKTVKKNKVMSSTAWDIYDYDKTNGIAIDLSWLNMKKDNYIQIKGDKNADPVTIKIPAVLTKVSAYFDPAAAVVTIKDMTKKQQPEIISDRPIEYKTQYGDWTEYIAEEGGLSMYQMRGAVLRFRLAAHENQSLSLTDPDPKVSDMVDPDGNQISVYETGNFPGVELKVAVKKQAAAPKVTVDYKNHQFSLPKNTEYRVVDQSGISNWMPTGDKARKLNYSEIASYIQGDSAALEVRIKAAASKSSSKPARVEFDVPVELQICSKEPNLSPEEILELDIYENGVGSDYDKAEVYAGYKYKENTTVFTDVVLFNESRDTYEIAVSRDGKAPGADAKVYTVRPNLKDNVDYTETYISVKNVKKGDKIYIRKKADTTNKKWSSPFAGLGTATFDPKYIQ